MGAVEGRGGGGARKAGGGGGGWRGAPRRMRRRRKEEVMEFINYAALSLLADSAKDGCA